MDINALTPDALELIGRITRVKIERHHAPIIGDYLTINREGEEGERLGNEPQRPAGIDFAFEAPTESGIIHRIYVGSKYHGPILMWSADCGWYNLFSNHNYGKNIACGGTWRARGKCARPTLADCLAHRDEDADALLCGDEIAMTESAAFRARLAEIEE